jgi:creatinine amidohydrolase
MRPKVRWEEMFPDELDAALARRPVVYLTYGRCEPHGLHNEGYHGDHAGRCETSQLWALRPELVDISRLAQGTPEEISRVMATGPDAGQATRQTGEAIVGSQIEWLGRKAAELLAAYQEPAAPASRTPGNPRGALTFGETEQLWRTEVEPLLPEFMSMNLWPGREPADAASAWAPNEMSHHHE